MNTGATEKSLHSNYILLQYKILFERDLNTVLVCEHFYHNLGHVTDGLKGIFGLLLAILKAFHRIKTFLK